jgi:hypothetical protein
MFIAGLVVPGVFGDEGVLFGAAFLVVCAMHVTLDRPVGWCTRRTSPSVTASS